MSATATSPSSTPSTRADIVVLAMLGVSLCINLVLGGVIYRLVQRAPASTSSPSARPTGAAIGERIPAVTAQRLAGTTETLDFATGDRPTIIYVFTQECQWCARNLANLRTLIAQTTGSYRVVAVSLDPDIGAYEERVRLGIPIYVKPSDDMRVRLGLGGTPQTVVISKEGVVVKSWLGAFTGDTARDVEQFLGLTLPGLTSGE